MSALLAPTTEPLTYVAATTSTASVTFSSVGGFGVPTLDSVSVSAVPEPERVVMALAGSGMLVELRARRNKARRLVHLGSNNEARVSRPLQRLSFHQQKKKALGCPFL